MNRQGHHGHGLGMGVGENLGQGPAVALSSLQCSPLPWRMALCVAL